MNTFKNNKNLYIILFFIFIANFIFRVISLGDHPLWYDECFSVFHAQKTIEGIKNVSKWDINPPGYTIILSQWIKLFGISEFYVRLFSVFSMALAGMFLYLFCDKYFNRQTAIFSSVLFLFSDPVFNYGQETRSYGFIVLLAIASSIFLFKIFRDKRKVHVLTLGFSYFMMIYTHYLTGFIILAHLIYVILFHFKNILHYIVAGCFAALLLLPMHKRIWSIFSKKTGEGSNGSWLPDSSIEALKTILDAFLNKSNVFIYFALALLIIFVVLIILKKIQIKGLVLQNLVFCFLMGIGVLALFFLFSKITPFYLLRYQLYAIIGLIIMLGFIYSLIKAPPIFKILIAAVPITFYALNLDFDTSNRMNYRELVEKLQKIEDDSTAIIIQTPDLQQLFLYYYDKELFKKPNDYIYYLPYKNIFLAKDSSDFDPDKFQHYQKIALLQTFQKYADPNYTLKRKIENYFHPILDTNINVSEFTIFKNDSIRPSLKKFRKFVLSTNIENEERKYWNYTQNRTSLYGEKQIWLLNKKSRYSPTLEIKADSIQDMNQFNYIEVVAEIHISRYSDRNQLIIEFKNKCEEVIKWRYIPLTKEYINKKQWDRIYYRCSIPKKGFDQVKVYFWYRDTKKFDIFVEEIEVIFKN